MKKILYIASLFSSLLLGTLAHAQQYACGGMVEMQNDCNNNGRKYHIQCCDSGRAQGVVYSDIKGQDHVDAVGVVCRSDGGNDTIMNGDSTRSVKTYACNSNETMVGIYSKDVLTEGGSKKDTLDGVVPFCKDNKTGAIRKVPNKDIKNGREGREQMAQSPKKIVGIAYKELDEGSSDRADCVTLITK